MVSIIGVMLFIVLSFKVIKNIEPTLKLLRNVLGIIYFTIMIYKVQTGETFQISSENLELIKMPVEWFFNTGIAGLTGFVTTAFTVFMDILAKSFDALMKVVG